MHSNKIAAALSRKQEGDLVPVPDHVGTAALGCPAGQSPAEHWNTIPHLLSRKARQEWGTLATATSQYCPYLPRTESSSFWES